MDHYHVASPHVYALCLGRGVQHVWSHHLGIAEDLDTGDAGNVEEHAAGHDRRYVFHAELRQSRRIDYLVVAMSVVCVLADADVSETVEMRAAVECARDGFFEERLAVRAHEAPGNDPVEQERVL